MSRIRGKKPTRRIIDFMERKSVRLDPKVWYVQKNDTKSIIFINTQSGETKEFEKIKYNDIFF